MKKRHLTVVGLSLLAAVSLAVGGCAKSDDGQAAKGSAASSSPSPADAKSALLASVGQLSKTTYKFHLASDGMTGDGAADPANKAVMMSMSGTEDDVTVKIDYIMIGGEHWIQMDLGDANELMGIAAGKYMHLDAAKLGDNNSLSSTAEDAADLASGMFDGLVDVKQVDGQHITGTIDLTKVSEDVAPDTETLNKAGGKAKAVPFTATLDSQGRLASFKVDMAAIDVNQSLEVSYSEYGAPVTISKPDASKVTEAPSDVYDMFKDAPKPSGPPSTK